MAHIVSRGAGADIHETWNYLHLSSAVHIGLQHTQGWVEMLKTYPHLVGKVNTARKRLGMSTIKEPEDLFDDIAEEDAGGSETPPMDGSEELVNKVLADIVKNTGGANADTLV